MNHTLHIGQPKNASRTFRRGVSLIPATIGLTAMIGVSSLAVDFGRIQLAKTELRRAADTAARAGASGLATSTTLARSQAVSWSKENKVDQRTLTDDCIKVTIGRWDTSSRKFRTTLVGSESYNAVRVELNRPATGADSVPLLWGSIIGTKGCQVRAEAIAMYVPGEYVNQQVNGTDNPFLAGMPAGSVASLNNPHNSPDYAGDPTSSDPKKRKQSPAQVPLTVTPGDVISFDEPAIGTVRHDPGLDYYTADGQLNDIGTNTNGNENGISDTRAPINALVGLFLGPDAPNKSAAPAQDMHGATEAGRNFESLKPLNKQIFFIGDGENASGRSQSFVVPEGATRLYLATWDYFEWNNNAGARTIKITRPGHISLVK